MTKHYYLDMEQPKTTVIDEVFIESSAFLLARLGMESRRKFTELVEPLGLSWQGQNVITALYALTKNGTVSQKQLADFVGIDPRNLVSVIDVLEHLSMLKRMPNLTDRRGYRIQLTVQGEAMARQTEEFRTKLEKNMLASLSTDEKNVLHVLLKKLWEHSDSSQGFQAFYAIGHGKSSNTK